MPFRESQENQLFLEVDELEEKCFQNEELMAFGGSNPHLKAVDFEDEWSETFRLYNLCRGKAWFPQCTPCGDGGPAPQGGGASSALVLHPAPGVAPPAAVSWSQQTCGLFFPAKMWTNTPVGSWKFYCKVRRS